jgi:hypothetical protein
VTAPGVLAGISAEPTTPHIDLFGSQLLGSSGPLRIFSSRRGVAARARTSAVSSIPRGASTLPDVQDAFNAR